MEECFLPLWWSQKRTLEANTGNTCPFGGDGGIERENRTGKKKKTFFNTTDFSLQSLNLSNCLWPIHYIFFVIWVLFPTTLRDMNLLDAPSPYTFLLPKTELGLIFLCYFYNLTAQLFTAWVSQVSALLLPDLPLGIWVQDRRNTQLLYCVIWQPLSSAPAWIYWAEQTVVCQEVSPHRNIGFTVPAYHPPSNSSQHSRKENSFPSVTWTQIPYRDEQDCSISGSMLPQSSEPFNPLITRLGYFFLVVLSAKISMSWN